MSVYKAVTHVIFDLDGLLLDTESLYTKATQAVVSEYGKTFTWEIKSKLMGKKELEGARILIDSLELPVSVDEVIVKLTNMYEQIFSSSEFMPGVEKLILHLAKHNIPIAIATGSNTHMYGLKTAGHGHFFKLFHHIVLCGDDPEVTHSKPAPDAFIIAGRRFDEKPDPEQVLVFEDAVNGVKSAKAAGMQCVWIPDPAERKQADIEATVILNSMLEFIPEEFGLPPYDR